MTNERSKEGSRRDGRFWLGDLPAIWLASIVAGLFVIRARHGIWFVPSGDEFVHFLGGRALAAGDRLYDGFVDVHGPVIFLLARALGAVVGWSSLNYFRVAPIAATACAVICIATCPILEARAQRAWAVALFVGCTTSIWLVQGLYLYEYYVLSACFIVVQLAWHAMPCWRGLAIGKFHASAAGACAALAVFTSHAWLPTVLGLFFSAVVATPRTRLAEAHLGRFTASAVAMAGLCTVWLSSEGSLEGYFAFHVYFVQTAYLEIIRTVNPELTAGQFFGSLVPSSAPGRLVQDIAIACLGVTAIIGYRLFRLAGLAVGAGALLATNARGDTTFQNATFVICTLATAALTLACSLNRLSARRSLAATALIGLGLSGEELAMHLAISSPGGLTRPMIVAQRLAAFPVHVETPEYELIRKVVKPDERFLALVYRPWEYWLADRLPMKGFYGYLPTDAAYARQPFLDVKRDLCTALTHDRPPAIVYDAWKVWDRYDPSGYIPCLAEDLRQYYKQSSIQPMLYIRTDRAAELDD